MLHDIFDYIETEDDMKTSLKYYERCYTLLRMNSKVNINKLKLKELSFRSILLFNTSATAIL